MSAANRARGARAEVAVVNWLRGHGCPDARRYLAGDGRQPGDIDAIPGVSIEVKDRKQSAWPTWRELALAEAGPNRIAVVVRRTRGVPDVGLWVTQMPLPMWRALQGPDRQVVTAICPRTERRWVIATFADVINLTTREEHP